MGGLRESWCFCNCGGGGNSERMKAAIFSGKGPAMASIVSADGGGCGGTGFLIHRNLLLTTHANLPSVAAAESAEIRLKSGVAASLFPHRFFITSSILDLTIVGLDVLDENTQLQQSHYLKTCSKPNLDLGSVVYLLGYTEEKELVVAERKVIIATDNLIKLSTDGVTWNPGSAGFDVHGNLAFMLCDPMKRATSPSSKCSSTSSSASSSWKKDHPTQFGIPIPIICEWLNQHWEGNLDEPNKPKLPLIRLISTVQKNDHACASFTLRQVFKSTEARYVQTTASLNTSSRLREKPGSSASVISNSLKDRHVTSDLPAATHIQGIPTPEIYESPMLTSGARKKGSAQIQLLDINFPPRIAKSTITPQPVKRVLPMSAEICFKEPQLHHPLRDERSSDLGQFGQIRDSEISSTGSVNGAQSEVRSSSSPVEISEMQHDSSSEGETTMYSAETAESRNYPNPRERGYQNVGRSQSCVNYNRWDPLQRNPAARRTESDKQRSLIQGRKVYSQGATSQRINDYYSPTVASIMKKRNSSQQPKVACQRAVPSSPRWVF